MTYEYYITPEEYAIAEGNGINKKALDFRVRDAGWNKQMALVTPVRQKSDELTKWAKIAKQNGIKSGTYNSRVHWRGWDPKTAATKPLETDEERKMRVEKAVNARRVIPKELVDLANKSGVAIPTLSYRIKHGWDPHKAATKPAMSGKKVKEHNERLSIERGTRW